MALVKRWRARRQADRTITFPAGTTVVSGPLCVGRKVIVTGR